ncbi:hypothetical protein U732_1660 [Clostridium argentinense CDC 2741]|uniref:Uncharacterized protein n=1 Tax=Clostridium argentinense CDC 2741 TaxID=1418104 RepID=A0A0C1U3U9_9CLOT|nr:hypothetical protein [Clostridium argentinense]KIE46163.1 hypothetical protein U732_1660 [Clostridium argentinense CDC 2741]
MNLERVEKEKLTKQKGLKGFRQYLLRGFTFVIFVLLMGCLYERIGGYKDEKIIFQ